VTVKLRNYGSTTVSNPSLKLFVNGTVFSTQVVSATIAPGDSLTYSFSTFVGFNPQLIYDLAIVMTVANDEAASDDVVQGRFGNVITGIDDNESSIGLVSIFPNPSRGQFAIKGGKVGQELEVSIYNIRGSIVFNQLVTKQSNELELNPKLPSGIYIIKATANQNVVLNEKLIITE
jgi:hypothetical protein